SIDGNTAENEHGGGFYNNGTVTLNNTDVSNGLALDLDNANRRDSHGGGFYNTGGIVNLFNGSDILNNASYGDGGGFRNASGIVNMSDGVIDGNEVVMFTTTTQHGGGFWNSGDAVASFHNVVMSNNIAGRDTPLGDTGTPGESAGTRLRGVGGAFYNTDGSAVHITGDSQLINNQAEDGGAFYNTSTGGLVTITGAIGNAIEISNNVARVRGGGFRSTGNTTVNLSYVDITNNSTDVQRGGGFYADGARIVGDNVRINNNNTGNDGRSGDEQGGGFWLSSNGAVTLTDSEIDNNVSLVNGGGFYVNNGTVTLTGSTVEGNFSENSGGGFFNENSGRVHMTDVSVSMNTASDHGGGFYQEDDGIVTGLRVNINDNLAGYVATRDARAPGDLNGGGFYNRHRGIVELTDSTIDRNEATFRGGGIFTQEDSRIKLNGVTVADNVSRDGGGGVWVNNANTTFRATNTTISGNSAGYLKAATGGVLTVDQAGERGGGLYQNQGLVELNHVTVTNNQATERAGGLWSGNRSGREGFYLENSIVFGNFRNSDTAPIAGDTDRRITLVGANVVGSHNATALNGNTAGRITTDPGLAALADNGGAVLPDGNSPRTHAISALSSAEGVAINSTLAVDQRGMGRSISQGAGIDLGAYEVDPAATTLTIDEVTVPETVISGEDFDVEALATTSGTGLTYSWVLAAPGGTALGAGTAAATLNGTVPTSDPVQTVDLVLTVTNAEGQSASETYQVRIVDPVAMPNAATAGVTILIVDNTAGNTLRDHIITANGGAGNYVITFAAGTNGATFTTGDAVTDNNTITTATNDDANANGDLDITKTNGFISIVGNG
ncbi:MAG: beta strand repeat-containing protein, partial [Planctomycetota bacterium]